MNDTILLQADSYKYSMHNQYPPGTQYVYSYGESRSNSEYPYTVFFGLQYFLAKYLTKRVTKEEVEYARDFFTQHFGKDIFNYDGWMYIVEKHDGCLPLMIRAVDEGSVVPIDNVLMTVENTDPECFWLTTFVETLLLKVWYPSTVATISYFNKQNILKNLEETGTPAEIDFKLHDFGFRGVSSCESAALGGAAHLVNFKGTDTVLALSLLREYYYEDMAGFSIPAMEHSTVTSWGEKNESASYYNMLSKYPTGLVACVSDSYDIYNACENIFGEELKIILENRSGCLVIRPDSGDPCEVLPIILQKLESKFGSTINAKGYKVLPNYLRIIWGDGIDPTTIPKILDVLKANKWSGNNLAFGSGGGLLQKLNRDTQSFAFKCSSIVVNGNHIDVYKNPVTQSTKKSKRGRLSLDKINGQYKTVAENDAVNNQLQVRYHNGTLYNKQTLSQIRENTNL
jgi:nicotinamide phosphoribosyltransferase